MKKVAAFQGQEVLASTRHPTVPLSSSLVSHIFPMTPFPSHLVNAYADLGLMHACVSRLLTLAGFWQLGALLRTGVMPCQGPV